MSNAQQSAANAAETHLAQPQPIQALPMPLKDAESWSRGPHHSNSGHHISGAASHGTDNESTSHQQRASSLPSISLLSLEEGQNSPSRHKPAISPSHSPSSPRRRSSHHLHHERHCSRVNEIKEGDDDNFTPDAVVPEMLPEEAIPFYDQTPPELAGPVPDSPERTSPLPIPGLKKRTSWIAPNPHGIPHSPLGGSSYTHSCSPLTTCQPLTPEARLSPAPPDAGRASSGPTGCVECPDDIQTFLDSPKGHYHGVDKAHSGAKGQSSSAQPAESSHPAQSLGLQM